MAATGPPIPHPMINAVVPALCAVVMPTVSRAGAEQVFHRRAAFGKIVL
jgi:hypothetical protein